MNITLGSTECSKFVQKDDLEITFRRSDHDVTLRIGISEVVVSKAELVKVLEFLK